MRERRERRDRVDGRDERAERERLGDVELERDRAGAAGLEGGGALLLLLLLFTGGRPTGLTATSPTGQAYVFKNEHRPLAEKSAPPVSSVATSVPKTANVRIAGRFLKTYVLVIE